LRHPKSPLPPTVFRSAGGFPREAPLWTIFRSIYSYDYADRTARIDPANHGRIMANKHRWLW